MSLDLAAYVGFFELHWGGISKFQIQSAVYVLGLGNQSHTGRVNANLSWNRALCYLCYRPINGSSDEMP